MYNDGVKSVKVIVLRVTLSNRKPQGQVVLDVRVNFTLSAGFSVVLKPKDEILRPIDKLNKHGPFWFTKII